jgi:hypothetical protein
MLVLRGSADAQALQGLKGRVLAPIVDNFGMSYSDEL